VKVLENLGVDPSKAQTKVIQALGEVAAIPGGQQQAFIHKAFRKTQALDEFGTNLTQLAAEGKLDPVVGRQQEIERATRFWVAVPRITQF